MKLDFYIDKNINNMINSLGRLVRIPSVGGAPDGDAPFGQNALTALKEVSKIATELGLHAHIYHNRLTIVDIYDSPFPSVGILAHADVVPAGNGWTHEPFDVTLENDLLYGRGVIDNKGPVISALYAMKYIKDNFNIKNNVRLIVGSDEEKGSSDLSYYIEREKLPEYVFTPDANYPVINTEKGRATGNIVKKFLKNGNILKAWGGTVINAVPDRAYADILGYSMSDLENIAKDCKLDVDFVFEEKDNSIINVCIIGSSAHASLPATGKNSVTALCKFLSKIDKQWESVCLACPHGDIYGKALNINVKDNVSGELTFAFDLLEFDGENFKGTFDIRYPVCMTRDELKSKLETALISFGFGLDSFSASNPHHTDADSVLVKTLLYVYENATGSHAEPLAVGGGTYAHGIPGAVAFGPELPGIDNKIHGADEFITVEHFKFNTKLLIKAITELDKNINI